MKSKLKFVFNSTLLLLLASLVCASYLLIKDDKRETFILFWIMCGLALLFIIELIVISSNVRKYIFKMNRDITKTQKETLYNFPAPAIIIDEDNIIVWSNHFFDEKVFDENQSYGRKITELFEIDSEKLYNKSGTLIFHEGRFYKIFATRPDDENIALSMVYFEDISQFKALEKEHFDSKPSVILIMIDNYEDLLDNAKESEKAHITAQLETLFEQLMENTTGIMRRNANDKFIAVVEERHIREMLDKRFDILDKAREIKVNDRVCVTLSMGVGRGAQTLAESEVLAKQALDMSLGRGGDQCAVKTENGFEFYGGVSKGIEKQTKVKTRIIATALSELMEANEKIFVMGHKFGDLDSIGSAIGLCGAARKMGKEAVVVVDPHKNLAKKLISYIKENDESDLFITPEQAISEANDRSLLIIVDTHNPDFVDSKEVFDSFKQVVVIDHHRKMVNYIDKAVIFYHEPYASSAAEMVAELIQYFGDNFKISAPQAEALLSGIMLDTKNFVMRTGVRTFEAAAFLRKLGADTVAVKSLFSNSIETYQQKSKLIVNAEIYHKCAIATNDGDESEEIRMAAPQAADELLGISDVLASFVLFDINGVINISARSLGGFNVQLIMEKLGGGGHQTMAGVQLSGVNMESARQSLLEAIDEFLISQKIK